MITDLWIENFKGIGKRQHIPLKPITLLFGANSAGKSTVLHSLIYLREILQNGNFDSRGPIDGENTVSLGGAESLLHRGNDSQGVDDAFELEARFFASKAQVNAFGARLNRHYAHRISDEEKKFAEGSPRILDPFLHSEDDDRAMPISISFTIGPDEGLQRFTDASAKEWDTSEYLKALTVTIGDAPFFKATRCEESQPLQALVNLLHPIWDIATSSPEVESMRDDALAELKALTVDQGAPHSGDQPTLIAKILGIPEHWHLDPQKAAITLGPDPSPSSRFKVIPLHELLATTLVSAIHAETSELQNLIDAVPLPLLKCELVFFVPRSTVIESAESLDAEMLRRQMCGVFIESSIFYEMFKIFESNELDGDINELDGDIYDGLVNLIRYVSFFALSPITFDRCAWSTSFNLGWFDLAPAADPHLENSNRSLRINRLNDFEKKFGLSTDEFVSRAVKGSLSWLRDHVQKMLYVGPKRSMVPRALTSDSARSLSTWGNGLAAWRWMLSGAGPERVRGCTEWLETRLGTGYSIVIQEYAEISREHDPYEFLVEGMYRKLDSDVEGEIDKVTSLEDKLWDLHHEFSKASSIRKLFLVKSGADRLYDAQDLGEGITQVVPVIAACVRASTEASLVAIEQPELHLHPSVAAKLGDLLVSSMLKEGDWDTESTQSQSLIETHSEHLILRILRRVRQTTNDEIPEHIPPVRPDDVCVMWVDNMRGGTTFQRLRIDDQGEFIDRWPQGFFSERAEELY